MEQPVQKSGMPRGCLIALIVGGIVIFLFAVLVGVCYFNKDKFVKWSVRTGVTYAQQELAKNPDGIDTVKFNALAGSFFTMLDTATISDDQFAKLGPVFSQSISDKKIDAEDIYKLSDAMVTLFPSLEPLKMIPADGWSAPSTDSGAVLPDDSSAVFEEEPGDSTSGD